MKLLLLEPNRLLAEQYQSYLETQRHTVVWRTDAQAGVITADDYKPDLVIFELLMAGHSGIEFLYEFRSYPDWLNVPVIILSGISERASGVPASTLEELGVNAYLYKPDITLKQLGETVQKLLTRVKVKK